MNDTPGWASPGSAPSDEQPSGAGEPGDGTAAAPETGRPSEPGTQPTAPGAKWSQQQPPAGRWSAPAGPGRTPPARPGPPPGGWGGPGGPGGNGGPGGPAGPGGWGGHGGQGGWGSPWGGPPPAAKPGVIPLRPLAIGEILDGAVSTMRTYWRTVLGISLTVAVLTEIVTILVQGLVLADTVGTTDGLGDPDADLGEAARTAVGALLGSVALLAITLLGTVVVTALLTAVTSRAVLGRSVTTKEAWHDARPQVLKLLGLIMLLPLIAAGVLAAGALPGFLVLLSGSSAGGAALTVVGLIVACVVTLWLLVRFSLAPPALMLEKQGIKRALSRSAKLVSGSWWRVLGIQVLATMIANLIAVVIVVPFGLLAVAVSGDDMSGFVVGEGGFGWTYLIITGIGSVLGSMITFPVTAGVTVLLYIDQRIRREALDLDLARAAGVQTYGTTAGS